MHEHKFLLTKIVLTFLLSQLVIPHLYAQQAPKIEWQNCLGGTKDEDASVTVNAIIQTSDGGIFIAGSTSSVDGDVTLNHGNDDIWVIKLSSIGKIQWQKSIGGSGTEAATSVVQAKDNGFIIAGFTNSVNGDFHENHGGTDGFVLKIDSLGNIEWNRDYGGSGNDFISSLTTTSDGGFALAGYTNSTDSLVPRNLGGYDGWFLKIDSSGNLQWQECYGGAEGDRFFSVIQTNDKGYIMAGDTYSNEESLRTHGLLDAFIVKINPNGRLLWQNGYGGTGDDAASSILQNSNGSYIFAGSTGSYNGDVSGNHGNPINFTGDAWIVSLDSSGDILTQKCIGGIKNDVAGSIIHTFDGGYIFAGTTNSLDGDVSGKHGLNDSSDVWVVKLSASDSIEWQKCYGGIYNDIGGGIIQNIDNGYTLCGRTESNDGDVSGNHGMEDIWVVKLSPESNSVENSSPDDNHFAWVYPNPSIDQIHLYLYHSMPVMQMQFYNLLGVQYFPEYQIENTNATVDVHNLPAGSYIVRVIYASPGGGNIVETQKFLHFQ